MGLRLELEALGNEGQPSLATQQAEAESSLPEQG